LNRLKLAFDKFYHSPADFLVARTSARGRRSFGFWTLVFAGIGAIFYGKAVLYVTLLSLLALIPNITAETPVEAEDEEASK